MVSRAIVLLFFNAKSPIFKWLEPSLGYNYEESRTLVPRAARVIEFECVSCARRVLFGEQGKKKG